MKAQLALLNDETLAVRFAYDARIVGLLKTLARRKWDPAAKHWEVHLAHLPELARIFGFDPAQVAPEIRARYEAAWGQGGGRLRIELGVLEGRLGGRAALDAALLNAIDAATSFEVPGAEFSELFRAGRWDGRRHLFNRKTLRFPAGLWPRIRSVLQALQVAHTVAGEAAPPAPTPAPPPPGASHLRPYQAAAVAAALQGGRGIIQVATGGGKTVIAAHLIRAFGRPTLFFVHTLDLLYQTAAVFERELGCEVGLLGDGQARLRPVTVATIQTAGRLYDAASVRASDRAKARATRVVRARKAAAAAPAAEDAPGEDDGAPAARAERPLEVDEATRREISVAIANAEVVLFDECHHVPAETFYKIAMKTRAARWRFGLSATPWRDDRNDLLLEAALGPKLCAVNASRLIDAGHLVAPRIELLPAPGPRMARRRGLKYADVYRRAIVENHERNRLIAARAQAWAAAGRSTLILVAQVAHAEKLLELLPGALFCWGGLDGATRQGLLDALRSKLAHIMIATTLADEGLDLPSLDGVILAGGGKSPTRAFQRIGRALRPAPGKQAAAVLDFLDAAPYLSDHSAARLALYRQEPRFAIDAPMGC